MSFCSKLLLSASILCVSLSVAEAEELRIAASDLLADTLTPELMALSEETDFEVEIDKIGSLPALDRLRSDEIDVAIIAVPEGTPVPRDEFTVYPFAYDVAVVVVNESNPLTELSISRLGGIFGANEEFNFTTWGDLGLPGWGSRTIKPVAGLNDETIALELFKHSVLTSGALRSSVSMVRDTEVESVLTSDAASIAIMPRLPEDRKIRAVMISGHSGGPAFGPTEDNVHFGDYPIRLSFFVAYHPRDTERMEDLLRTLLSEEVAEALREDTFFPLPDAVRRKLIIDLDIKK